jgi:hypothetical protein
LLKASGKFGKEVAPEIFEGVVDKVADEVTKGIDYVRKLWANT